MWCGRGDSSLTSRAGLSPLRLPVPPRGSVLVASGDRDTFQLASGRTTILYPVRAGEMARIGPHEVRARYGVDPKQVPDFIVLRGEPGAPGVGATGAATLLQRYGSLEGALAAGTGDCRKSAALPIDRDNGQ